ncbi:Protein transport protein S9 plasma membrane t-SNARE [Blastocladiella emersonii ATCC 22665]|nr:Protein transport protein S9 plasma membrane t-SNARE [Blastocladiella emersonii ATCC 22665]
MSSSKYGGDRYGGSSSSNGGGGYSRSRSRGPADDRYGAPAPSSSSGYGSRGGYGGRSDSGYLGHDDGGSSSSRYGAPSPSRYPAPRQPQGGYPRAPQYDERGRDELFQGSGYDPRSRTGTGPSPPNAGGAYPPAAASYERRRHEREDEGYFYSAEDEEHAYQETRGAIERVKDQSVDTSRSALRRIRETEEVAAGTARKLQEQTDKLTHVEQKMTEAEYHAHRAENKTQDLQRLNKNFIASAFSFSNPFTRSKRKEEKLRREIDEKRRLEEEKEEQRKAGAAAHRAMETTIADAEGRHTPGHYPSRSGGANGGSRSRAHYLDGEEDCDKEREIDSNLDEISAGLGRLKMMASAMGDSIEASSRQADRISRKTDGVTDRVRRTDAKLGRMRD